MATTPSTSLKPLFDIVYQGTHIYVNRLPLERGRATHRYEVLTREDSTCIARIEWYSTWRTWILAPKDRSVWSEDCLRDIAGFLEKLRQAQRNRTPLRSVILGNGEGKAR